MKRLRAEPRLVCGLAALAVGCSGGTGPNNNLELPSVACASKPVTQLAVGQHVVLDPASSDGCLRFPAVDAAGAQYLVVLASTNGTRSTSGIEGPYLLRASNPLVALEAPEAAATPAPSADLAAQFDATLRRRERELAADPANRRPFTGPVQAAAPPVGDVKTFKTCSNLTCSGVVSVQATARFVGQHVAIYLDNEVPQTEPLTDGDLAQLGTTFDTYHYPIDTTAFGRESDLDGNGLVIVLMTDAVNNLTPDCTNGRVIGYFYGGDLLPGPNSNSAEIFYTLVPAPATPKCTTVTRTAALNNLKPTLIHEFQHMISFNQHVLLRGGLSEETWLNEGLSHFAEELGGRLVPNSECIAAGYPSCRSQYTAGDILNAYDYLKNPEGYYTIFPTGTQGTLPERGAAWLFLRWILDQFSPDSILATPTTRALNATTLTGMTNVLAVTGGSVATMVPEWLMAAYLDDGTDLPEEPTGRLRYKSWGLRGIWTDPRNNSTFTVGFPLVPLTIGGSYSRTGTLKQGSGRHFLVVQNASGPAVDLQVLKSTSADPLDAALQARYGVVRIH